MNFAMVKSDNWSVHTAGILYSTKYSDCVISVYQRYLSRSGRRYTWYTYLCYLLPAVTTALSDMPDMPAVTDLSC